MTSEGRFCVHLCASVIAQQPLCVDYAFHLPKYPDGMDRLNLASNLVMWGADELIQE